MATNVGPLTTVFTPPAACFTIQTSGSVPDYSAGQSLFIGHFGHYDLPTKTCSPPATTSIDYYGEYYYSPAYCPSGYTTACAYSGTIFPADAQVTSSLCCPNGFDCVFGWPHVCSSSIKAPLLRVWVLPSLTATMSADAAYITIQPGPGQVVWNDGVPVAWAKTDQVILDLISSAASGSLTSSPSVVVQTTYVTATSSAPSASITPTIPKPNAKGHATTIIFLVAISAGILIMLYFLYKLWRRANARKREAALLHPPPDQGVAEADSTSLHELPALGYTDAGGHGGRFGGHELDGSGAATTRKEPVVITHIYS